MKEQTPNFTPRFTFNAEERKAFLEKGMSEEEIIKIEQEKNALLRDSREEKIRERAFKNLEENLGG